MKTIRQRGFTLVELMVATLAGIILVLATGMLMSIGHNNWNAAWKRANLQRDASYVMLRMNRPIRAGISAKVDADGKGLRIYTEGGWMRFFVAQGASKLTLKSEIGSDAHETITSETILDDKIEDLQFNVTGNTVTIDLKLKEDDLQTHFVSTIMMRNYGG